MPANPPKYPEAKVLVYIDGHKCTPVRARTWAGMGLKVGDEISCEELKKRESFHWKKAYGKAAWEKEGVRLGKVKTLIEMMDPRVVANIVGFGAGSTEFIAEHPAESGKPDIEVVTQEKRIVVLVVEVTGTETMRGAGYWVRPDKLNYAKEHPEEDVWLILHYADPVERFVFIRPSSAATYKAVEQRIRDSIEHYVVFTDSSHEVVSADTFRNHLRAKVDAIEPSPQNSDDVTPIPDRRG
jgi:hypothetical protein